MISPMSDHSASSSYSSSSARMTGHIGGCVLETVSSSEEGEEEQDQFDETVTTSLSVKGSGEGSSGSSSVVVSAMDISQRGRSRGGGRERGRGPIQMDEADHSQSSSSSVSLLDCSSLGFGMDTSMQSRAMPDTSLRAMDKDTNEDLSFIFRNTILARGASLLVGRSRSSSGGGGSVMGGGSVADQSSSRHSHNHQRRRSSFCSVATTGSLSRQSISGSCRDGIPLTKNRPKHPINPNVALLRDNDVSYRRRQPRQSNKSSSSGGGSGLFGRVGSLLFGGKRRTSQTQRQEQEQPHNDGQRRDVDLEKVRKEWHLQSQLMAPEKSYESSASTMVMSNLNSSSHSWRC